MKKRVLVNYKNLSQPLLEKVREEYPQGFESKLSKLRDTKQGPEYIFPLETEETLYMIKYRKPTRKQKTLSSEDLYQDYDLGASGDHFEL